MNRLQLQKVSHYKSDSMLNSPTEANLCISEMGLSCSKLLHEPANLPLSMSQETGSTAITLALDDLKTEALSLDDER